MSEFWYPLHTSGTVEARNFKFGMQLATGGPKRNNAKLGQKGSLDLVFEILGPLYMSGTVEARNVKFGMQIGHWSSYEQMQN